MRSAKSIAEGGWRSGADLATKATTHRRLVGGLNAIEVDLLELSDADRATLAKAKALLGEIANTYASAAGLKKREEEVAAKRRKDVRAAMKGNFEAVTTVADKVAVIAFAKNYLPAGPYLRDFDARYLVNADFQGALTDLAWSIAAATRDAIKGLAPATAVEAEWQRFLAAREQLQQRHAAVITTVERLLAEPTTEPRPC